MTGLRVLVISQYFWPENFRINELVQSLVLRGTKIDVLTGKPNYPDGTVYEGYHAMGTMRETWHGANVFRVPLIPRGLRSGIRLFLNYLSFMLSAATFGPWLLRKFHYDIIFVYAPSPLLKSLPAILIGRLKRAPVAIYVQDLWPESLEATGHVRNRQVIRLVELLVRFIYRHADLILVSSHPFIASIRRFSPTAEVIYYPNSVDASFSDLRPKPEFNLPALECGFTVVFAGNVGTAQAVHVITEAAALLNSQPDIHIVVFGSGSKLEWMRSQISENKLDNLVLAGSYPMHAMPSLLSQAGALLVTLSDREIFASTVPNKLQAYMAIGKPIIAAMNGEGARLVKDAQAGLTVPAENAEALADAILKLRSMSKSEREKMGSKARDYYLRHFDHEKLVTDLQAHLSRVTNKKL